MPKPAALIALVCSLLSSTASIATGEVERAGLRSPPSTAKPTDEVRAQAERYFRAGLSLHKLEDFDDAAVAYEASLRLMPTKSALFNLANCHRALHQYVQALESLERLHAEFGDQLVEPMLSKSRAQIQEIRNLTGTLVIETEPTGATVYVNGALQGTTPFDAPVRLKLGAHSIEARLEGYEDKRVAVELLPRAELTTRIVLDKSPDSGDVAARATPPNEGAASPDSPASVTVRPPAPDDDVEAGDVDLTVDDGTLASGPAAGEQPLRPWGWVGLAAGVAAVAVGGGLGLEALRLDDELSQACPQGTCPRNRAVDLERLNRLTSTADVLVGAGTLLAVGGAIVLLWPSQSERETEPTLDVSVSPTGFGVVGRSSW